MNQDGAGKIGMGFNSVNGKFTGHSGCYDVEELPANEEGNGGKLSIELQRVESSFDMYQKLGRSFSASLAGGIFGVSASHQFTGERWLNRYVTSYIARVSLRNATREHRKISLTPEARALLTRDFRSFVETCGDMAVVAVTTGAELHAAVTVKTFSEQERQSVETKVGASFMIFSASAEFKEFVESKFASFGASTQLTVLGGRTDQLPSSDLGKSVEAFLEGLTRENSRAFEARLLPLESMLIDLSPDERAAIRTAKEELRIARTRMTRLAKRKLVLEDLLGDVEHVEKNPLYYIASSSDLTSLADKKAEIEAEISTITELGERCAADYTTCVDFEEREIDLQLPASHPLFGFWFHQGNPDKVCRIVPSGSAAYVSVINEKGDQTYGDVEGANLIRVRGINGWTDGTMTLSSDAAVLDWQSAGRDRWTR